MRVAELCGSKLEHHVEQVFELGRLQAILAGEKYCALPRRSVSGRLRAFVPAL